MIHVLDKVAELESLLIVSKNETKVDILNDLCWEIEKTNPKRALSLAEKANSISTELNYSYGIAKSFLMMGYVQERLALFNKALGNFFKAQTIFFEINCPSELYRATNMLGYIYCRLGNYDKALLFFQNCLTISKEINDMRGQSNALNNIGEIYCALNQYNEALGYYEECCALSVNIDNDYGVAGATGNMGYVYNQLGNYKMALEFYDKSIKMFRDKQEYLHEAELLNKAGEVYFKLGDDDKALDLYQQSLKIAREMESLFYEIDILSNIGKLYMKSFKTEDAEIFFTKALHIATKLHVKHKKCECHLNLSIISEHIGNYEAALYHYKLHHLLEKEIAGEELQTKLKMTSTQSKLENMEIKAKDMENLNKKLEAQIVETVKVQKNLRASIKKLESLSTMDELTGIANRRSFDIQINNEWKRCMREAIPLSIFVIDIDYFKRFNDTYGHIAGDTCLKKVARVLKDSLRRSGDFIARYGGEEFFVILPNTDRDGAYALGELLREKVEGLQILIEKSDFSKYVTISLGIATIIPTENSSLFKFIDTADLALYKAKQQGRNMVVAGSL